MQDKPAEKAAPSPRITAARAFIRSLNILMKFARLYGFEHVRTTAQFETAWNELHDALPTSAQGGLLLGASGTQLLLDGAPIEGTPAERSFAQLLSASGVASIQFASDVQQQDLSVLVRAFPTGNANPSALAQQLKTALAHTNRIRINEIRFVAQDGSQPEGRAAQLMAKTLGGDAESMRDWLRDPRKLLQLIAAAEGSQKGRGPGFGPGAGPGLGRGLGKGAGPGAGAGWGPGKGPGPGTGSGPGLGTDSGPGSGAGTGSGQEPGAGKQGLGSADAAMGAGYGGGGSGAGESASEGPGVYEGRSVDSTQENGTYSGAVVEGLLTGGTGTPADFGYGGSAAPSRESSGGSGDGGAGSSGSGGSTSGNGGGDGSGSGQDGAGSGGLSPAVFSVQEQDLLGILKMLTQFCGSLSGEQGGVAGPLQTELANLPLQSQELLKQALVGIAARTPEGRKSEQVLLQVAEHLAIRFALERYQRGEVKVNAVRQMLDRMSQEIEGLRKILGTHEEKLAELGVIVESHADTLDRQFWASVPEAGKQAVLGSSDAWCVPARNIKQYIDELLHRGEEARAVQILQNYTACLLSRETEGRRRASIGIAELAELYSSVAGGSLLGAAIQTAGTQLNLEREESLEGLMGAAFVRLAQEACQKRVFPAMIQTFESLDSLESQRLTLAQSLEPRIGFAKRVPELVVDGVRAEHPPEGLIAFLQHMPHASAESMVRHFNRTTSRAELQRVVELAEAIGADTAVPLRDALRTGLPAEGAEVVGLLSRLDPASLERWLPERVHEWPRSSQDRMVRLIAMGGAPERGTLLAALLNQLDPLLLPMAIDEIGLSEDASCIAVMRRLAESEYGHRGGPFVRLKAIEALGRLKARAAAEFLQGVAEARHMFHWTHPAELRLAALQALAKADPLRFDELFPRSGFNTIDLTLGPLDPQPGVRSLRRRRYPRVRLRAPIPAFISGAQESHRVEIRKLGLGGGVASVERHPHPGSLFFMKLGSALHPIRARVLTRDARAQGLGFEFVEMDLDERSRLRKLLAENLTGTTSSTEDEVPAEAAQ